MSVRENGPSTGAEAGANDIMNAEGLGSGIEADGERELVKAAAELERFLQRQPPDYR
jgi:hypothetical protein